MIFKTACLALMTIVFASCTNDIPIEDSQSSQSPVKVVFVKDGEIVETTRANEPDATPTLAFSSEKALNSYQSVLASMDSEGKKEYTKLVGISSLASLEDIADAELDSIGEASKTEEEFRFAYSKFVEKYAGRLISNYLDESDLSLYAPTSSLKDLEYIANRNGEYVVGNKVCKLEDFDLPESVKLLSSIETKAATRANNPTYINSYVIKPKRHKRVKFTISRKYDTVQILMRVDKKMWYGWKIDPNRDLIFEPYLANVTRSVTYFPRYWTHKKNKIDIIFGHATGASVTGTIHTWTDMSAEFDANDNIITTVINNCIVPKCEYSKSTDVIVNLPYNK
jgi:hypothetical protein